MIYIHITFITELFTVVQNVKPLMENNWTIFIFEL